MCMCKLIMIIAHLSGFRGKIIIQLSASPAAELIVDAAVDCIPQVVLPCHGNWFPLRQDSHAHESRNQTPAFVLFDALQVDKRTEEGGGWGMYRGGEAGASQIFGFSYLLSAQAER